jgi:HEAT repeat protein
MRAAVLSLLAAIMLNTHAADLTEFLGRLQSDTGATRAEAVAQAGPLGASAVVPLGELASANKGNASIAALWALRNIAVYAGRPGGTLSEKQAVADAFTLLLESKYNKVTRCQALDLLSITGDDRTVPKVAALLADPDADIADEARRGLEGTPGTGALQALIDALPKAQGRLKLAVINALGQRGDLKACDALAPVTAAADTETALAALEALARIGLPAADRDRITLPNPDNLTESQRLRVANLLLRWADRRAAAGANDEAAEGYGLAVRVSSAEHVVCAALLGAAKAAPEETTEHALRALGHEQNSVRVTAARVLEAAGPDDNRIKALLNAYPAAKPETRDLILRVLKTWNDRPER